MGGASAPLSLDEQHSGVVNTLQVECQQRANAHRGHSGRSGTTSGASEPGGRTLALWRIASQQEQAAAPPAALPRAASGKSLDWGPLSVLLLGTKNGDRTLPPQAGAVTAPNGPPAPSAPLEALSRKN